MAEFMIGVFVGYVMGKAVGSTSNMLRKPEKVLKWDSQSLGYRPVPPNSKNYDLEGCIICYEVKGENQKRGFSQSPERKRHNGTCSFREDV